MKYTNSTNIPLILAVWLASDDYDYNSDPRVISATTLLKSTRQAILSARGNGTGEADIFNFVNSGLGSAIHSSIENAWKNNYRQALEALGYPKKVIDSIVINPTNTNLDGLIPIYLEQRSHKEINGWTVSGKYDAVLEGKLIDYKSTGTFTYINKTKVEDYQIQGSIYRWLNPGLITEDYMSIMYIFTDWSALKAKTDPEYPKSRLLEQSIKLMPLQETERWVINKLNLLDKYWNAEEPDLPLCNDKELWIDPPVYKYYKDPTKTARSTKNADTYAELYPKFIADGSVGVIKEIKGTPKACGYCNAFSVCSQAKSMIKD